MPNNVNRLYLKGNTSLRGIIKIDATPTNIENCFKDTVRPIFLTGKSNNLLSLIRTANNHNVFLACSLIRKFVI